MTLMDRRLDIPLLHIHGDGDPYVLDDPVRGSRRYAPGGKFAEIPGAGHYAHEEVPQGVNDQLMSFLAGAI